MEEIVKHINDTNASYRDVKAGDAKNTDLFLDNEHYELFRGCGNQITVRFSKENLSKAILFISSILPRKYDNSGTHMTVPFSSSFVFEQLALLDAVFSVDGKSSQTRKQTWNVRKDVPKKDGTIDSRFYFNGLLEDIQYVFQGESKIGKFTIRNYLAGGFSDLHIVKAEDGVFDVMVSNVLQPYNDGKEDDIEETVPSSLPLNQIFYGPPGTGKSHTINQSTSGKAVIRTTFHPDSDYSTFVGAYKPTTKTVPLRDMSGHIVKDDDGRQVEEDRIVYEFVAQAFLKAYIAAWQKQAEGENPAPQYLVIEEINRGNCAQIFGDLFQLLDRNDHGFSDYPIQADNDMRRQLQKSFAGLTIPGADDINALYGGQDVVRQVLSGDILLLPSNLLIWATMNTSDQSLFPIDSAFKRRWDWTYVPIADARKHWKIKAAGCEYDWWQFLSAINSKIGETTNSEDKKLGYFFCKAGPDGTISADTFVGKVIFYLWNDVFKDYEFESDIFNDEDGSKLTFDKFHTAVSGKAEVIESKVQLFLQNLGLKPITAEDQEEGEDVADDAMTFSVTFPDGEKFDEPSKFDTYFKALQKIGLDKVEPIAAERQYHRKGCPLVSKERFAEIDNHSTLRYVESGGYFVVRGISNTTMCGFLKMLSERLSLNLDIVFQ